MSDLERGECLVPFPLNLSFEWVSGSVENLQSGKGDPRKSRQAVSETLQSLWGWMGVLL